MVGSMTDGARPPLDGITVLDFSQIEMGPCATQVLGDFGADVIKIERPGAGDLSRVHMKHPSGESAIFWSLNRNKRSVAIDVRSALGREAIYRLARAADVVVHNFRPGVMERLGFGADDLRRLNPRLIYAFGSGYGPVGPYRDKGGQDVLAQAMSGIASRRADPAADPEPCAGDRLASHGIVCGVVCQFRCEQRSKARRTEWRDRCCSQLSSRPFRVPCS